MIHHSERGAGYLGDEKYTDTQHAMLTHKNSQNKSIFFIETISNFCISVIFLYSKICYINHTEIEPKTIISWRRYISFANLQNLIMAIIGIITCNKPQHTQARTFPWSFCVLSVLCTVYCQAILVYCVLCTVRLN